MKLKKQLREHFSIEQGSEMVVGPAIVEVTHDQFKKNEHKFEPDPVDEAEPAFDEKKKKSKKGE
jgi:hypothetical protein